jgi:hypothetical protein
MNQGTNDVTLFIFCNHKERMAQTYIDLIASLLKQLVQERSAISPYVKGLYDKHFKKCTRPNVQEFLNTLRQEIDTFYTCAYIIVDALDEGPEQSRLLYDLRHLSNSVRLMVTSRDLPSIGGSMREIPRLEIHAQDEDIEKYIESRLSQATEFQLRHLLEQDPDLQQLLIRSVKEKSNGMWVLL